MIIVISIGGSVLISDLDPERIYKYAENVKQLTIEHTVYVVVGGGRIARDYISAARALGANEVECDVIGIDMTRINARLLIAALGKSAYPEPP
ncbi:MAG TPA: UMP kinase, partial [Candidatus Nanoarchaeia archaeon]|nr:UMP kinase [Candidatus Nanoarchaeia archaeon]